MSKLSELDIDMAMAGGPIKYCQKTLDAMMNNELSMAPYSVKFKILKVMVVLESMNKPKRK